MFGYGTNFRYISNNINIYGQLLMFTRVFRCFFTLLLVLPFMLTAKMVAAKETIWWQTYHRPPSTFTHGDHKNQGFVQKIMQLIIKKMPNFNHEIPVTTFDRAMSGIKSGQNVCHPALYITPERKKYMLFSNASMITPNSRVIAKPETIAPYVIDNQVDLAKILQQNILTFSHVDNRSYGIEIDAILKRHQKKSTFFPVHNINITRVFKMLERNRMDVSIAYSFEIQHYLEQKPESAKALVAYPVANISPYDLGSVACPKNAWGENIIRRINEVLKEIKPTLEYKNALTSWREHERKSALFNRYYNNYFLNN